MHLLSFMPGMLQNRGSHTLTPHVPLQGCSTQGVTPPITPHVPLLCRHSARFLFVWISVLPFALYPAFGWGCIPVSVVMSALLLGIDEIGVQIEEPL